MAKGGIKFQFPIFFYLFIFALMYKKWVRWAYFSFHWFEFTPAFATHIIEMICAALISLISNSPCSCTITAAPDTLTCDLTKGHTNRCAKRKKKEHVLFSQNMFLSSAAPIFIMFSFHFGWDHQKTHRATAPPAAAVRGKRKPTQSPGKLPIKIQHCMVMNTRPMVKGLH